MRNDQLPSGPARPKVRVALAACMLVSGSLFGGGEPGPETDRLFPAGLPQREWLRFPAAGFSAPVTGAIYKNGVPEANGDPQYSYQHTLNPCVFVDLADRLWQRTGDDGVLGEFYTMPASTFITAMNYAYAGNRQACETIAFRCLNNLVNAQGMMWDMPNIVRGDPGHMGRVYGFDYYQCMSLWGLPAALAGEDLAAAGRPGGLVDRILAAARAE
jgi:hypothetical protein